MKPKYSLFKNASYALSGVKFLLKDEMAFRIEFTIILPLICLSLFFPISFLEHFVLVFVLVLILIVEALNSAIEACVDLCTSEFHILAKKAKDCASAGVLFSVVLAIITWSFILFDMAREWMIK
ncbi:diacylglycerol kinase [Campylobacter subantarcticus LMG 24377]|uniref:Diacylglycerol kinase n=2 Tax=Campylobacter subantarcticus TaxID=497724 RepID=A0A0A8H767_9BACT|nr:diacylglycerol kinase [Campylobacter subantarcticus]EAJ1260857.1 diacylglycerol kinase [Campylobacter lari]AJC89958.1 diacylglycerol kinase [Campylobacter subantarcticus LMG 24374]AJC91625.1 diacylglycerol kinase [Campylobacter subantarcticus LMG 24377]EAL3939093.1 diacylglycerol kinase [Campylobacter lari]MPB98929.1 diacylglycerol kinase [Campylobacter subantarcticus]